MGEIEQWFSYSEDGGFRRHASADEARACAQRALDDDTDASGDGWPEETGNTCWGEVREAAVETITHKHGPDCRPDDEDADKLPDCTDDFDLRFDHISRFDLTPTTQASEVAAATARAKAAEQRAEAAEAELQQARADARLILAAFVGANAEGVIEYRMTNADRDAIDVLIESVYDTLEDSLLVTTIRRVASIPDNPQETSETSGSVTE